MSDHLDLNAPILAQNRRSFNGVHTERQGPVPAFTIFAGAMDRQQFQRNSDMFALKFLPSTREEGEDQMPGILIATLLATVAAKAPMEYASGDLLYSDCGGSRQFVTGYVSGWLDKWNRDEFLARQAFAAARSNSEAMVNSARFGHSVGWNICLPPGTTPVIIGDMLCHFLQDNPGVRGAEGDDLVMTVISRSYGCR